MNNLTIPKWKDKNKLEKTLYVLGLIIAVTISILACLDFFDVYETINIFEPLLGVLMIIQCMQFWKYERKTAIISLIAGLIILACGIVLWLL